MIYQNLPTSMLAKFEDPSVNIPQIDLDARIAAAFADGAKSTDVITLIQDAEDAAASASDLAEQARNHAFDPTLSGVDLENARKYMDDAGFQRDRLQAASKQLRERLAELKDQEENERRQMAYDKAKAIRDELAIELADLYPAFAQKLTELVPRIVANNREIDNINNCALPKGVDRLLVAELKARGLPCVMNSIETPRIIDQLYLPPWQPR
jgi:DNA-binding transcriptional MerR regulator